MTIEIERIEIVTPIQGRTGCVMAQRVVTVEGETRPLSPINLYVGDLSNVEEMPTVIRDTIGLINKELQSQVDQLMLDLTSTKSALSEMTTELDSLNADKEILTTERDSALEQVSTLQAELDAIKNPPNPFPNADWEGFRDSALSSPVILKMMGNNPGRFMMLVIYMEQIKRDPSRISSFVDVWNQIENAVPLNQQEILGVNSLASAHGIPLQLNDDGQIKL